MKKGKLIVFTAPSGAGKTTLVRHLLQHVPDLRFSVSATTRPMRQGEVDGRDYHFLSDEAFAKKVAEGEFLEYEQVYDNIYYGTLKRSTDRLLEQGNNVIFDIDVKGARNIKKHYGACALTVFVAPPSFETLRQRLTNRRTETDPMLRQRLHRAQMELECAKDFDALVVNDDLDTAKREALELVGNFLEDSASGLPGNGCCKHC